MTPGDGCRAGARSEIPDGAVIDDEELTIARHDAKAAAGALYRRE